MSDDAHISWQPMATAPRDGSLFVVKREIRFMVKDQKRVAEEIMLVNWCDYADKQGGWWLEEGAVIPYETCIGWWPVPK